MSHIHSVVTDVENIYAGSHHGLYVWKENEWKLQGDDFGENFIGVASNIGSVLKSSDGGTNWENVQVPVFNYVAINPGLPSEILIVNENGLSLSNDFAISFANVGSITNVTKID